MKASQFSDAQKAFILKQGADGGAGCGDLPAGGDQLGDLLQLEEEIRRAAGLDAREEIFCLSYAPPSQCPNRLRGLSARIKGGRRDQARRRWQAAAPCQTASNVDPGSASNIDPLMP
jgi:putative transposase